jgi:hypothetical protein
MQNTKIILRLTYLWAFIEAGLGGMLHLLHLPVTGLIIGGFAIIVIVLISKYSTDNFLTLLKSLSVVLAVKFIISPHTPFGAYIAVGFQGLIGASIFYLFRLNRFSILLFSMLVMIESALQKPIMAWLIFGKEFWKVALQFIEKNLNFPKHNFIATASFIFFIYLLVYTIWAVIIANWANYLRNNIEQVIIDKKQIEETNIKIISKKIEHVKHKSYKEIFSIVFLFLLVLSLVIFNLLSIGYLLRLAFTIFILFLVIPITAKKYQHYFINKNKVYVNNAVNAIPALSLNTQIAFQLVKPLNNLKQLKQLIIYTIWLNVFYERG